MDGCLVSLRQHVRNAVLPGDGEDAPQAAQVEHIQAFIPCCMCCPGIATMEERADDPASVHSHFGGNSELLIFRDTLRMLRHVAGSELKPLSYFLVSRKVVLMTVEPW